MALKRHPALQDYSREHHDELLLVWKIKEGLRKNIPASRIKGYVFHHFTEVTELHMEKEEKYILSKLQPDNKFRIKILSDHAELTAMAKALINDTPDNNNLLLPFADKLENHVRYEEREFFPALQDEFSEEQLSSMQPRDNPAEACAVWGDPFWEKSAVS